jgi:surface antigen
MKQKFASLRSNTRLMQTLVLLLILTAGMLVTPLVQADRFDEQIKAINQDNAQKRQAAQQLQIQADSLAGVIAGLQAQISALETQINENQAKKAEVQHQIALAEEELAKQRKLLGENIKAMYLEGQISTLEMLASSKDLSEFVDKQQYRNSVKDKIKDTLDKVTALKLELKSQQEKLDKLIADQEAMQYQLDLQRAENDRLLAMTVQQKSEYEQQIKNNNAQIAELRRQQAVENARLFASGTVPQGIPGGGGYPGAWAFAPMDSIVDTWGMYNRECVSYTAWKVWQSGRYMPYWGGIGNANQWDDNARAAGIPTDSNPRVGDVAISNRGFYGHAMYVEAVNGDGTITVSQYNAGLDGYYSVAKVYTAGLVFIHF